MDKNHFLNQQFICNLLNIISRYAMLEDAPQTLTALENVTEIIRYTTDSRKKTVTLKEEIGILSLYFSLIKNTGKNGLIVEDNTGSEVIYINHLSVYLDLVDAIGEWVVYAQGHIRLKLELKECCLRVSVLAENGYTDSVEIELKGITDF